jgi:hypothetical protein
MVAALAEPNWRLAADYVASQKISKCSEAIRFLPSC